MAHGDMAHSELQERYQQLRSGTRSGRYSANRMVYAPSYPQGYAACCAAIRDADFRETVRKIAAPTLVFTGAHDPVTTPADGRFLASNIHGAKYVELRSAHLSNVEASAEFNAALLEFLLS